VSAIDPKRTLKGRHLSQVVLNDSEAKALARAVRHFVVRSRTGELGITHGADRFVSTNDCFKKADLDLLESALKKLGMNLSRV